MSARRSLSLNLISAAVALALLAPLGASAAGAPAIAQFDAAFANVHDYTMTVKSHEFNGSQTQDRVYHYWFMKPHFEKIAIVSGPGSGGGAVWNGGSQVSGHQGGMLSFIHPTIGLHDSRATSLLGYTMIDGLMQSVVDKYREVPGQLSQQGGPVVDGAGTEIVTLKPSNPAADHNINRWVLYLSKTTHFPIRQIGYDGSTIVIDQWYSNIKTNVGLTQSDFPF